MQAFIDKMGEYFYDSVEVLLDFMMLFFQIPLSWGIYLIYWFDSVLPGGTDWRVFWASMPIELINFGLYVGLWDCVQMIVTMMGMKAVYKILRGV